MPVNLLKVDVLSSPSLMTICGLGQLPEQADGGQVGCSLSTKPFMVRQSKQIPAFEQPHALSHLSTVPVRARAEASV